MEKAKKLQLPIIVLLLLLLIWKTLSSGDTQSEVSKVNLSNEVSITGVDETKDLTNDIKVQDSKELQKYTSNIEPEIENYQVMDPKAVAETQGNDESKIAVPFDKQSIDYEWAYRTENAIHDIFTTHQYLDNISLKNIECRTSTCQLRISKKAKDNLQKDSLDNLHQASLVQMALDDMGIEITNGFHLNLSEDDDSIVFLIHEPKYR